MLKLEAMDSNSLLHKPLLENAIEEEAPDLLTIHYEYNAQLDDYEQVNDSGLSSHEK